MKKVKDLVKSVGKFEKKNGIKKPAFDKQPDQKKLDLVPMKMTKKK